MLLFLSSPTLPSLPFSSSFSSTPPASPSFLRRFLSSSLLPPLLGPLPVSLGLWLPRALVSSRAVTVAPVRFLGPQEESTSYNALLPLLRSPNSSPWSIMLA
ncbi:hypothetical protein BDW71DRAFT_189234 [Aspergillus fruticulosus]